MGFFLWRLSPLATLACLLAGGCGPTYDLASVPIEGGTAAEREQVREVMLSFDAWTGGDRVRLRSVEIAPQEAQVAGAYYPGRKRIVLRPGLSADFLAESVRHELCHALDHQEGTPSADQGFEALHDAYLALDVPSHEAGSKSAKRRAMEGFALFCEQGPWENALSVEPCDGLPSAAQRRASWVRDTVWTGIDLEPSLRREVLDVVSVELDKLVTVVVSDTGTLAFGQRDGAAVFVDGPSYGTSADDDGEQARPPTPPTVFDVVGRDGQAAVALTSVGPGSARMLLGTDDGERWAPVEASCRDRDERIFEVGDGELGTAWLDGDELVFTRLVPAHP